MSVCFSRANTLVTCSALITSASSTRSTATNTASNPCIGTRLSTLDMVRSACWRSLRRSAVCNFNRDAGSSANGAPLRNAPGFFSMTGILVNGYHLIGQTTGCGISVALQCDQTRAGYARQYFDIAIERYWHRHQVQLFLFQCIGKGNARIIRMLDFRPQSATARFKPSV